jgi:hypothetical protein
MGDEDITKIVTEGSLPLDLEDKTTEPRLPIGIIPEKQPTLKDRVVEIAKEHPGKVIVAGVMVLALGGALLGGGGEPKGEPPHVQVAISETMKTPVRFSGGALKEKAEKVVTVFGDSVIYESIPQEATCSVVFEAKEKKVGSVSNPVLTFPVWWMTPGSFPLLVQGSSAGGLALWWATFQGNGCLAIADRPEYIGSDIHQLLLHPKGRQLLLQKAKDNVKDANGQAVHAVPFLDPQASSDDEVWFPHALAGRDDLNYAKADGVHPRKRKEQE